MECTYTIESSFLVTQLQNSYRVTSLTKDFHKRFIIPRSQPIYHHRIGGPSVTHSPLYSTLSTTTTSWTGEIKCHAGEDIVIMATIFAFSAASADIPRPIPNGYIRHSHCTIIPHSHRTPLVVSYALEYFSEEPRQ